MIERTITRKTLELVCPAGTPAAFRAAVDAGADTVYCGLRDDTNARNFPGLNFSREELAEATAYAHAHGVKLLLALNTYKRAGNPEAWHRAVNDAAQIGVDAMIMADIGLLDYAATHAPKVRRHLSVQAAASTPEAVRWYVNRFDVRRVVLPRVLTVPEIALLNQEIDIETEVFGFGGLCVMTEGRCSLSSYVTGKSPNMNGVCSPASHVRYEDRGSKLVSKLGDFTINSFDEGEKAGYPTLCKGRFEANGKVSYLFEDPTSLNVVSVLPDLIAAGVTALKLEGRQRGRAYTSKVVAAFRLAIDTAAAGAVPAMPDLSEFMEGGKDTTGAYQKSWQ